MWLPWAILILLSGSVVWLLPETQRSIPKAMQVSSFWQALWPLAAGIFLSAGVWVWSRKKSWHLPVTIPEGDLIGIFPSVRQTTQKGGSAGLRHEDSPAGMDRLGTASVDRRQIQKPLRRIESWLANWQSAGLIFLLLIGLFFFFSRLL
jgi:hypothetical protein